MAITLVDLNLRYIVEHTIRTVLENPKRRIAEIFGDARLDPHAALYGQSYFDEIEQWITTTKIPVVLGFDLAPAQIPGVTIALEKSMPVQTYLGDTGLTYFEPIPDYERDIVLPYFTPKEITPSADGLFVTITLPDQMPVEQSQLVLPGLNIRDKNRRVYGIGLDGDQPTAIQSGGALLKDADLSEIEIISPYNDALYREGVMSFDDTALIAIHGHADRTEGLWLWAMVHWGLCKFRPLLISVFGMDMAISAASDFTKDTSFMGENVWTRFISVSTRTVWSWEAARQQDVLAFLLSIRATGGKSGSTVQL